MCRLVLLRPSYLSLVHVRACLNQQEAPRDASVQDKHTGVTARSGNPSASASDLHQGGGGFGSKAPPVGTSWQRCVCSGSVSWRDEAVRMLQASRRLDWECSRSSESHRLARHSLDVCRGHLHEAQVLKLAWDIF